MKVSVIFCKSRNKWNIFLWLLRKFENTNYDHCAILYQTEESFFNPNYVIESTWPKAKISFANDWCKKHQIIETYTFEVNFNYEFFKENLIDKVKGKKYSMLQNLIIGLTQILSHDKELEETELNGRHFLNCTEVIGMFLHLASVEFRNENLDNLGLKETNLLVRVLDANKAK